MKYIKQIALMLALGMLTNSVSAESDVTVTARGYGVDRQSAINMALSRGLEQALGVYILSSSNLTAQKVADSDLHTIVNGSVSSYDVVKESQTSEGTFNVEVKMNLSQDKLLTSINIPKNKPVSVAIADLGKVDDEVKRIIASYELLKAFKGNAEEFVKKAYIFDVNGYEIDNIGRNGVEGSYLVTVRINPLFWSKYREIIEAVKTDPVSFIKGKTTESEYERDYTNLVQETILYEVSDKPYNNKIGYTSFSETGLKRETIATSAGSWTAPVDAPNEYASKTICGNQISYPVVFATPDIYLVHKDYDDALANPVKLEMRVPGGKLRTGFLHNIQFNLDDTDKVLLKRNPDITNWAEGIANIEHSLAANRFEDKDANIRIRNKIAGRYTNCAQKDLFTLKLVKGGIGTYLNALDVNVIPDDGLQIRIPFKVKSTSELKKNGMHVDFKVNPKY